MNRGRMGSGIGSGLKIDKTGKIVRYSVFSKKSKELTTKSIEE